MMPSYGNLLCSISMNYFKNLQLFSCVGGLITAIPVSATLYGFDHEERSRIRLHVTIIAFYQLYLVGFMYIKREVAS